VLKHRKACKEEFNCELIWRFCRMYSAFHSFFYMYSSINVIHAAFTNMLYQIYDFMLKHRRSICIVSLELCKMENSKRKICLVKNLTWIDKTISYETWSGLRIPKYQNFQAMSLLCFSTKSQIWRCKYPIKKIKIYSGIQISDK
jgi:hypothetical protein